MPASSLPPTSHPPAQTTMVSIATATTSIVHAAPVVPVARQLGSQANLGRGHAGSSRRRYCCRGRLAPSDQAAGSPSAPLSTLTTGTAQVLLCDGPRHLSRCPAPSRRRYLAQRGKSPAPSLHAADCYAGGPADCAASHQSGTSPVPAGHYRGWASSALPSRHIRHTSAQSGPPSTARLCLLPSLGPLRSSPAGCHLQSSLATQPPAAPHAPTSLPPLTPFSGSIPTIPTKFATAAAAGEFIELLHALEADGGDEPPIFVQVGEDHQLSLPRKP